MAKFDETQADVDFICLRRKMLFCNQNSYCYRDHGMQFEQMIDGVLYRCWCFKALPDGNNAKCENANKHVK